MHWVFVPHCFCYTCVPTRVSTKLLSVAVLYLSDLSTKVVNSLSSYSLTRVGQHSPRESSQISRKKTFKQQRILRSSPCEGSLALWTPERSSWRLGASAKASWLRSLFFFDAWCGEEIKLTVGRAKLHLASLRCLTLAFPLAVVAWTKSRKKFWTPLGGLQHDFVCIVPLPTDNNFHDFFNLVPVLND